MLSTWEQELRAAIQRTDTPFLGLLGDALASDARIGVVNAVAADPTVEGYIRLLYRYPALFATHLTATLMAGMGQSGTFDIYSHVRAALQLQAEPSSDDKEALWGAFRSAVLKLGLEVSPRTSGHHFMADTYLRQVGVPLAFADDLAQKMLSFANSAGIPERDDPEGIARWQSALGGRLTGSFSRVAQRAVALDSAGFYTNVFIKVHDAGASSTWSNTLEQAMAKAFDAQSGPSSFRRASLPFLALTEGDLGIFVPAAESARAVEIIVDGQRSTLRIGSTDELFALAPLLPTSASVYDPSTSQTSSFEIWSDSKPNRMLLFTEAGRFKGRAQLGTVESLVVPPGRYLALSRFCPEGVEPEELSLEPRLFQFPLTLHPGERRVLANGPATMTLQGEARPLANWLGTVRGSKESTEFLYGEIDLELEFPPDWLKLGVSQFEVSLSSNKDTTTLAFSVNASGRARVSISDSGWTASLPPGMLRILAEVRRPGEVRSLLRTSVLYWNGLESVSEKLKFRVDRKPANLEIALCENFSVTDTLIQPKDSMSRHLSLAFQLGEQRIQAFSWNAPGIFVEVAAVTSDNERRYRLSRPLGSTEVVSLTSTKQIIVSCSEAGELSVGDWSHPVDFARHPSKLLQASFLASRIAANANALMFRPAGSSVQVKLLNLVQPHYLSDISEKVVEEQLVIKLSSPNEVDALRVEARDLMAGQNFEIELQANDGGWTHSELGRARLMSLPDGTDGYTASVYIAFDPGVTRLWIFNFEGRIAGVWGQLQNQRGDHFAAGFISLEKGPSHTPSFKQVLAELTDQQSLALFAQVSEALIPCYAEASWEIIDWLATVWHGLIERWRGQEASGIATLVNMACASPSEEASPSWMPQNHIGAELPRIYALPAGEYRQLNALNHPLSLSLRAIALMERSYPIVFGDLLHVSSAMGFSNPVAVAKGQRPRDFSLKAYELALQHTGADPADIDRREDQSFMPGPGDYLGPLHYRVAHDKLDAAYMNSLGGNEIRRGQAIGLCRHVRQVMSALDGVAIPRLKGTSATLNPWPQPIDEWTDPEFAHKHEILSNVAHFLSLMALHCRASARASERLDSFLTRLKTIDIPVDVCLTYLLQIGDAVFAYYLLLWDLVLASESSDQKVPVR